MYPLLMRFLGIDYGRRRIGLALSDATGLLARPWNAIARDGNPRQVAAALAREIAALRAEGDGLEAVVLGFPRRLSGEANEQTSEVNALAEQLRQAIDLPIVLQDERLTSVEAEWMLAAREKDWRRRKPLIDAAAAAIILQDYLDARPRASRVEDRDW
jgi:putative Holliday junction resolvase